MKSSLEMQHTISNTDELLLIYGINFLKNRESHRYKMELRFFKKNR